MIIRLSKTPAAGLLAFALVLSSGAEAAEWRVAPDVRIGVVYNDDVRLTEGDREAIDVAGARTEIGLLAERRTETLLFRVRPRLTTDKYTDNREEEADDQFLDFSLQRRGLRSQWAIAGNFSREQVYRGGNDPFFFDDPDLENPDLDDPGRFDNRRRRTILRLSPNYSYRLSEQTEIGGRLSYAEVSFRPQQLGEALDYADGRVEGFLERRLSPRSRFRTTLFASRFEVDEIDNLTNSYGLRARYDLEMTEVHSVFVDAGIQYNKVEAGTNNQADETQTGGLLEVGMRWRWQRTAAQAVAGRAIQPSGTGFLREVDRIRLTLNHDLSERWYWNVAGLFQTTDALASDAPFNQRDYYEARARLGHQLTQAWLVELGYNYRHLDQADRPGAASSNEVLLSLNYQPRGRAWSW